MKRLEELIVGKSKDTFVYNGGTEGHPLYYAQDAAIQRAFLKAGTKFAAHSHESTEIVIVISGHFSSTTAMATIITPVAGVIVFPPGTEHSHSAETDCWVIGILIPCGEGYPDSEVGYGR